MYVPDMHYVESYYKDKSNDKTEVVRNGISERYVYQIS